MDEHSELRETVLDLLAGLGEPAREAVWHLVQCSACLRHWLSREAERRPPAIRAPSPAVLEPGPVLRRLAAQQPALLQELAGKAERARQLLARLLEAPPGRRELLARSREFRNLPLADLLLARSEVLLDEDDAAGAADLAWLALTIAERPFPAEHRVLIERVKARGHGLLAGCRRLAGDLAAADEHLARARVFLTGPVTSPETALHDAEIGRLRLDQGRLEEGEAHLRLAAARYEQCGELHESRRCQVDCGLACLEQGRVAAAAEALTRAAAGIDPGREAALGLRARLALALCHAVRGRRARALGLLERSLPLLAAVAGRDLTRIAWLAGRVAAHAGARALAAGPLLRARQDLLAAGRTGEAALAALDLDLLGLGLPPRVPQGELLERVLPDLPPEVSAAAVARIRLWYAAGVAVRRRRVRRRS